MIEKDEKREESQTQKTVQFLVLDPVFPTTCKLQTYLFFNAIDLCKSSIRN